MLVDVIRHQHERIGNAVCALMSLTLSVPQRLDAAGRELALAYPEGQIPDWAARHVATIHEILRTEAERAQTGTPTAPRALDALERERITTAFFELYTVACREYWTA
jgi:hypothetical protein